MQTPDWYIDELIHAGDEHLDADYVQTYDEKAGFDPDVDLKPLVDAGLSEMHTLIDFGAGTGTFALAAAKVCKQVIAVDVSPVMVRRLTEKVNRQGISNVDCVQAGFLSYQHVGDPVDFVYSRHALHHLPDFWKFIALKRIAATMKSSGVMYLRDLVFSSNSDKIESVLEEWFENAPDDSSKGWTAAELKTHVRDEYSTFSWLLEPIIEFAGFRITGVYRDGLIGTHSAYTCIKR